MKVSVFILSIFVFTVSSSKCNKIYQIGEVDEIPKFPGGDSAMITFIGKNFDYTKYSPAGDFIGGRILYEVIVEKNGKISIVKNLRPQRDLFDAEAIRVIKAMPKWIAGKKDGKPVRVYFVINIIISPNN